MTVNQKAHSVFQFAVGDKVQFRCPNHQGQREVERVHNARVIEERGDGDPVIVYMEDDGALSANTSRQFIDFIERDPGWDPFGVKPESDDPKISKNFRPEANDLIWARFFDAELRDGVWRPARVESRSCAWRFVITLDGQQSQYMQILGTCPILTDW